MANILGEFTELVTPTAEDAQIAGESSRKLAAMLPGKSKKPVRFKIRAESAGKEESVELPLAALRLLNGILAQMAMGNTVTLVPIHAELTTQEAADLLNVSRPYLIEQVEKGAIPHRMVGTHRRILFQDLMEFKALSDKKRLQALQALVDQAQELNMGY